MTRTTNLVLISLAAAGFVAALAIADSGPPPLDMPDPALTPGAIATTDVREVCGWEAGFSYTKRHRVWTDKAGTLAKYGLPISDRRLYEDDDLVPVSLGGDNADPRNHWPEIWVQARIKDELEVAAHRAVCDGRVSLQEAQSWFLGDWRLQLWRVRR